MIVRPKTLWGTAKVMTSPRAGVLFDVDGTLVDTNYFHTVAWTRGLRDAGEYAEMAVVHRHLGMGSDHFTQAVLGHYNDEAVEGHANHWKSMWSEAMPFDGAAHLLRAVHEMGLAVVLASSASPEELEMLRKAISAEDVIDHATGAGDVDASKPEPDIFQAAMQGADLDPAKTIVVGDTVWDVEAARKAGVRCIGVLSGGFSEAELKESGAIEVYDNARDLLRNLETSAIGALK